MTTYAVDDEALAIWSSEAPDGPISQFGFSRFLVVIIIVILPGVDMCSDFHRSESVK